MKSRDSSTVIRFHFTWLVIIILCRLSVKGQNGDFDYVVEQQSTDESTEELHERYPQARPPAVDCHSMASGGSVSCPETPAVPIPQPPSGRPHDCERTCSTNSLDRRTCTYNFVIDWETTMGGPCGDCPHEREDCKNWRCIPADEVMRSVCLVNHMLPGPSIRVCEGDTVVVNIFNNLNENTSIHWHGIHQKRSPFMDGVPQLTQCYIQPYGTFRYQFETPLGGTYFWHSHSGYQRGDGLFGALIVRKPEIREPFGPQTGKLYDYDLPEHEMIVMDWLNQTNLQNIKRFRSRGADDFHPRNILVNGKGLRNGFFHDFRSHETIQTKGKEMADIHEIQIRSGSAYRLRLIGNGVMSCPLQMSIENHTMEVIASDGFDINPVQVDSLVIYAGERWDVIVRGNQPRGSYWIKFRGLNVCSYTKAYQVAVLNYRGIPRGTLPSHSIKKWEDAAPPVGGLELNPLNTGPGNGQSHLTVADLTSLRDDDPTILTKTRPDHKFYVSFDFNPVIQNSHRGSKKADYTVRLRDGRLYTPQINFISNIMPSHPPLTYPDLIPTIQKCSPGNVEGIVQLNSTRTLKNCKTENCHCTHWLQVERNSIVEIILIDKGHLLNANHPFHLHGHSFRVVGMDRLNASTHHDTIRTLDQRNGLRRTLRNAPIKDTVTVPDGGYTIIRFRADNPGFWYFHCHIEYHSDVGMGLVFQVGNPSEIPAAPSSQRTCWNPPEGIIQPPGSSTPTSTTRPTAELRSDTPRLLTPPPPPPPPPPPTPQFRPSSFWNPIHWTPHNPSIHFNDLDGHYYWPIVQGSHIIVQNSPQLTNWNWATGRIVYTAPRNSANLENPVIHRLDGQFYIYFNMRVNSYTRLYVIRGTSYPFGRPRPDSNYGAAVRLVPWTADWLSKEPIVFRHGNGHLYVIWSGRLDSTDSRPIVLYIARLSSPTTIGGPTAILRQPHWRPGSNECPQIIRTPQKTVLMFRQSGILSHSRNSFCYGKMEIDLYRDPLYTSNWQNYPDCFFYSNEAENVYNLGRFGVTTSSDQTEVWIVYLARSHMGYNMMESVRAQKLWLTSWGYYHQRARGLQNPLRVPSGQMEVSVQHSYGQVASSCRSEDGSACHAGWEYTEIGTAVSCPAGADCLQTLQPINRDRYPGSPGPPGFPGPLPTLSQTFPPDYTKFQNPISALNATPSIYFHATTNHYYWPIVSENGRELFIHKSRRLTNWSGATSTKVYTIPSGFSQMGAPIIQNVLGTFYIYFHMWTTDEASSRIYVVPSMNTTSEPDSNYFRAVRLIPQGRDWFAKEPSVFAKDQQLYLVWSGRITEASERPHVLYIAPLRNPMAIGGSTVLLRRPSQPWEGIWGANGFPRVFQPAAFGGKKILIFTADEPNTDNYCLGMMELDNGLDPLVRRNWKSQADYCVFGLNGADNVFSVGSYGLTYSRNGSDIWLVYQASENPGSHTAKSVRAQPLGLNLVNNTLEFPIARGLWFEQILPRGD